jgi:hypothetical protein
MTFSDWTGVIGVLIAVISLGYAWWEKRSRTRLEDYIRAQNWFLYDKASNSNGHTQLALSKYKALGKEAVDLEVLEFLSKADAFGQDVFKDTIRHIHFSESAFDDDTVSRWVREGRVAERHAHHFRKLTPANKAIQPTRETRAPDG